MTDYLPHLSVFLLIVTALMVTPSLPAAVARRRARRDEVRASLQRWIVAEQRRAMMQSVLEECSDGIAVVDREGLIQMLNPTAERILETSMGEAVGTPIHARIPWSLEIEQLYDGGEAGDIHQPARKAVGPCEFTLMRKDGTEPIIELAVRASKIRIVTDPRARRVETRIVHIYTLRDITERKRAEDAGKEAMERAITASRAKSAFLANMSHELRTPLNAVIGFSEVMKAQPFGPVGAPEYVGYVEDIFQSGHHLLAVINDILDMSKIEAGEMKLTETIVHMPGVINACVRLIAERARKMQVEVSIDAAQSLPWLCGDERMIKQMLLNLLTNAVKFTPEGGRVTVRAEVDPVGCLVISVSDTGVGIAPEDLGKVLQPFHQADDPLRRHCEGTGLGLPLVKAMAELHGALLVLDSTVNVGTTAAIRFPQARITAAPQTRAA